MSCQPHNDHSHVHGQNCGHTQVQHEGHTDYLHDGHMHSQHGDHVDEHVLSVNATNPTQCTGTQCAGDHQSHGDERVPHGDHMDYIHNGRLHTRHGDHCDDHGALSV